MKLKLIGMCSFFIFCLTLKGRKVGASSPYGKLVDSTLKLIGFESPPKDAAEWERAFFLLSSEYTIMRSNLTTEYTIMRNNLTTEYTIMKNNLTTEYVIMKNNPTSALNDLPKDYSIMKNNPTSAPNDLSKDYSLMKTTLSSECEKYKEEYLRIASVQFTRKILEDADWSLTYSGLGFPSIAEMKKQLQKEKGHLDETAVSEAKWLGNYETTRRMRWLYYMTYAEQSFAKKLRKSLRTWKVSAFELSRFFDTVFAVSCGKNHGFSFIGLDVKHAEAGFQMYGVRGEALLHCLHIIFEIPNLTGFLPDNFGVSDEAKSTT